MTRFDVIYFDSKGEKERKHMLAGDVIDFFKSLPWQESFQECFKTEDAIYDYTFSVYYTDAEQLEQSMDIEIFIDDENKSDNQPLRFDVCAWYQNFTTKKVLFGLFGEKKVIKPYNIILDNQDMDTTVKYLQAFVRLDTEYLKSVSQ